ncbi:MAG: trigger factor [Wenzhouxiangellaceae bacterium]
MQVTIEETGALERLMKVQVPADQIENKVRQRFQELSRTMRMKGFRRGKVPLSVVQKQYGQQVRDEVTQEVMQNSLRDAIEQESLRVAALPDISPLEDAEDGAFAFSARVELYPEIEQLDISDLKIKQPQVEITDQDIEDMLKTLQEQRREWHDSEAPAADGERVFAEYSATLDGEKVPAEGRQRLATVLGSGVIFAELEDALRGMKAGEDKSLELTFPEDYSAIPALAGQTAPVELHLTKVQGGELPEVNDEFAAAFGIDGGADQLRVEVRENLERELTQARSQVLRRRFVDALVDRFESLELPPSLLRREAETMRQNMIRQITQAGGDESRAPSSEDLAPTARRRVLAGYLFGELAQRNDIQLDQRKVVQAIERVASTYDDPQQVIELYMKEQQLLQNVQQQVMEEQIVEWSLEQVAAEDEAMAFSQLIREARNG